MGEAVFCRAGVDLGYDEGMGAMSQAAWKVMLYASIVLMAGAMVVTMADRNAFPALDAWMRTFAWREMRTGCAVLLCAVLAVDWLKRRTR